MIPASQPKYRTAKESRGVERGSPPWPTVDHDRAPADDFRQALEQAAMRPHGASNERRQDLDRGGVALYQRADDRDLLFQ